MRFIPLQCGKYGTKSVDTSEIWCCERYAEGNTVTYTLLIMGSVPVIVNRAVQISTSISIRNVKRNVILCSRMNVFVVSQCVRTLKEGAISVIEDDFCDVDYPPVRGRDFNKRATVSMLLDVFRCSPKEVESIVLKYPELKFVSARNAQSNIQFLKDRGVPEEVLQQNPWLLKYRAGD